MSTRGGSASVSLNAALWAKMEDYLAEHPEESRSTVLRAALVAFLGIK